MPKVAKELGALEVKRLRAGVHQVGGVAGLCCQVKPSGARSWLLRIKVGAKRREIGLGAFPQVGLAEARRKAAEIREQIVQGVDPVASRRAAKAALIAEQAKTKTFRDCAEAFLESKLKELRSTKSVRAWSYTLEELAYPKIGALPVSEIGLPHVLSVLEPHWTTRTETANRLRGRIESVLSWATVSGYRSGDNPAKWRGNLDMVLPKPSKVSTKQHHAALPVDGMPAFWERLKDQEGLGARALELAILTAARSGEVRGALWSEIDLDARLWTVPASRMKAGREHVVPLSDEAAALLESLPRTGNLVFTALRGGTLSDMTLSAVCRRMKVDAVPHGMRSTFRTWAAERTSYPVLVAELCLAHDVQSNVEAAYQRSRLLDQRRRLMADWARFVTVPRAVGEVVGIREERG